MKACLTEAIEEEAGSRTSCEGAEDSFLPIGSWKSPVDLMI
jgi:hypothetical protein